jgi:catechol-2,3-dioxygenase
MNKSNQSITGLAEISLRVHDLDRMRQFYEQVIGLRVLKENRYSRGTAVFYAVGPGDDNLALFEETLMDWYTRDKSPQIDPKGTTLAHFAFSLALDDCPRRNGWSSLALRSLSQVNPAGCTVGCSTFTIRKGT